MKLSLVTFASIALALCASAQTEAPKPPPQQADPAKPAEPAKPAADSQAKAGPPASATFTTEQLEQIIAPIALHPDTLLAQILMASTYPLEIVEAYRWQQKNAKLKGTALAEGLKGQDWDPSVKSLCELPSVLKQMNDNLDWTQDLGDAFLGQKEELMKTVQTMRKKALEAGNLKTSEQQKVSQEGEIIVVESSTPDVVYVPTYYPTAVYGGWYYPSYYYPPMYPPYPTGGVMFGFAVGIAWAGGWGGCNWGGSNVYINHNTYNNFNKNTSINGGRDNVGGGAGGRGDWNHNPEHRKGANYKDSKTAQKYGGSQGSNRVSKDQARGYDRGGSKNTPSAGNRAAAGGGARPSAGNSGAGARPSAGTGAASRPAPKASSGALSGSRSPSMDRSASSRGASSRSSGGSSRSSGSRGGGSRGGGGGRRR